MELQFAAAAFATAFTIIDPIGMMPLTLASTSQYQSDKRRRIIDQAVLVAAAVALTMGHLGRPILGYLGITLPAFSIAGGVLLFLIAIDMLFARDSGAKCTVGEKMDASEAENPAVFPLAIPMIAGPGTIATILLLVSLAKGNPINYGIIAVAYATALFVTWLCMRGSTALLRVIGNTGVLVVTRLLGIILAALAVQFVINGLGQTSLLHH